MENINLHLQENLEELKALNSKESKRIEKEHSVLDKHKNRLIKMFKRNEKKSKKQIAKLKK